MIATYSSDIRHFQESLQHYVGEIFKCSANELILRLEQLNLLNNNQNCLESSTAFGFIIEEFLVSKLDDYTLGHDGKNGYRVQRAPNAVTHSSFDCVSEIRNGIRALVNLKIGRSDGPSNDGVAAIQQLYHDYVETDPDVPKCFLLLKVEYSFCQSIRNGSKGERAVSIKDVNSYFLDEVDLSIEHLQDNRKWSKNGGSANSGRLKITDAFRKRHTLPDSALSYDNTVSMLKAVYQRNVEKDKTAR